MSPATPARPMVIAHRGDSAHRPENTFSAFASALELGARFVELDVQLTRDGEPVVIHDATVDRTTNGTGAVADFDLAQLRRLSAGYPDRFGETWLGERIPTLDEALTLFKGRARVMIEIKSDSVSDDVDGGVEARTIAAVIKTDMASDVALISFDGRALERCRQLEPEITRGHLFYRATADEIVAGAERAGCDLVMPEKGMLDAPTVARLQAAGLKVATWVVDDPEELRQLASLGLFGVGSNCPGILLDALHDDMGAD